MGDQENGEGDSMLKSATTTTVITTKSETPSKTDHKKNMKKFAIACLGLQVIFAVLYLLMARYDVSADARYWKGGELKGVNDGDYEKHVQEDLKLNLEKYPCMYFIVWPLMPLVPF